MPPEGAITRTPAEVTPGDVTRLSATIPTNTGTIYIPPGAEIEWFWQLTATDRTAVETERETFRYEDPRYDWQVIERGDLQLHYYENEGDAQELLVVGSDAIARMSELLGIQLDFPARIYLWSNGQDAAGVERVESDTFEQLIFTGGTRVLADLVHVFAPERWIVAHELTHILTKVAGEGGVGSLPAWLDEGTATYAEGDWRSRRGLAIARAVERDDVLSVRSIGSSTSNPGDVDLFYGSPPTSSPSSSTALARSISRNSSSSSWTAPPSTMPCRRSTASTGRAWTRPTARAWAWSPAAPARTDRRKSRTSRSRP